MSPFTVMLIDIVLLFWLKRVWTREYARESMMIWLLPFGHRTPECRMKSHTASNVG